jgi:hypothetical protein
MDNLSADKPIPVVKTKVEKTVQGGYRLVKHVDNNNLYQQLNEMQRAKLAPMTEKIQEQLRETKSILEGLTFYRPVNPIYIMLADILLSIAFLIERTKYQSK